MSFILSTIMDWNMTKTFNAEHVYRRKSHIGGFLGKRGVILSIFTPFSKVNIEELTTYFITYKGISQTGTYIGFLGLIEPTNFFPCTEFLFFHPVANDHRKKSAACYSVARSV